MVRTILTAVVAASISLAWAESSVAVAQDATGAAVAPTNASTAKQIRKAQRKAARKAAREKRNADLNAIEKNGYKLTGDKNSYPDKLQDAERKAAASKATTSGAPPAQ
jgi:hypothetical protein